jgi:hypothetical protein
MQIWHISAYFKKVVQLIILGRVIGSLFFILEKYESSSLVVKYISNGEQWVTNNLNIE